MEIILASNSPRREELLRLMDLNFKKRVADINEETIEGEAPEKFVARMALEKAVKVSTLEPGSLVIGADTIVCLKGKILGKPKGTEDAKRMLKLLSDKKHEVLTAVALVNANQRHSSVFVERTKVQFDHISDSEIDKYVETGEPLDKAGSYGIQGRGALFVKNIEGCYYNVMGLPVNRLFRELTNFL